jgi:hypothetical protein
MHSTFPRFARALVAVATLAVSAAAAGPALAAPPPRDEALEEAAAARKPPIPSFQDPDIAIQIRALAGCETFDLEAIRKDLARDPREAEVRAFYNTLRAEADPPLPPLDRDQELLAPRDVRITCAAGNVRIAIYLGRVKNELEGARNQGLARVNLTPDGTLQSAIRVHPRLTELLEHNTNLRLFEIEKDKRNLRFEHFGPKGPQVRFVAPNQVVTTVKGKDTRPLPDVSFTTTITDTLSAQNGVFGCTTRTHTNANTTVHKGLLAAGILTAPANFGVAAAGFGAQLAAIELGVAAENRSPASGGPVAGCSSERKRQQEKKGKTSRCSRPRFPRAAASSASAMRRLASRTAAWSRASPSRSADPNRRVR